MIGDSRLHRCRDPQRLVNPAETVVHEIQGDKAGVLTIYSFAA